MEAWLVLFLMS